MKPLRTCHCALALGVVVIACLTVSAQRTSAPKAEKPSDLFSSPDRNPVNLKDKNVLTEFDAGNGGAAKNLLWKAKVGKTAYGGPAFSADKVLVGTNNDAPRDPAIRGDKGVMMCFDLKTGNFLWQNVHDKLGADAMDFPKQGIASTPVIEGDKAWYVSNRCEVVCLDVNGDPKNAGKAKTIWTYNMIGELKVFPCQLAVCNPLIVGDLLFVVTGNGWDVGPTPWVFPSPDAPSFIAINKTTGKLVWKDSSPGKNVMEGQWSNPVFASNNGKPLVIFPGGDGVLYAFDAIKPDKPVWKFNCNPKAAVFDHQNKRQSDKIYFIGSPTVHDNKLYVAMGVNPEDGPGAGHVWCIDVTKQPKNADKDVSPGVFNVRFMGIDLPFSVFDPKDPVNKDSAIVWHFGGKNLAAAMGEREYHIGRTLSTVMVADGLAYVPESEGFFHCLDAKTGQKYWTHDFRTGTWSSGYFVDGKVFLGNDDGDLMIFEHGKQYKKPDVLSLGPPLKRTVHVKDGVVYILTDSYLYAFGKK